MDRDGPTALEDAPPDPPPRPTAIYGRAHARRRVVRVIQESSCRVRRDDGSREDLSAKSVVILEPCEWVEHGGDGGEGTVINHDRQSSLSNRGFLVWRTRRWHNVTFDPGVPHTCQDEADEGY